MKVKKATAPVKKAATKSVANRATQRSTKATTSGNTEGQQQTSSLFEKLFIDMLKDIYWAEQHLVEALGIMQTAATTSELQDAFEDHKFITQKHVSRLEKVFGMLGMKAEAKKCDAMAGLTKEANAMISETMDGSMTRDAALIIAAQKVEHYEIATYGSLVQVAITLGHDDAAALLEKTLWEEEDTDKLLTQIAETNVNPMADSEDEDMNGNEEAVEA